MKDTFNGALPVVGVPAAVAVSRTEPWFHGASKGSPRAAWSAVVMGNVERPRLPLGSMMPGWTFSMTRSIAASTLLAEYATCVM